MSGSTDVSEPNRLVSGSPVHILPAVEENTDDIELIVVIAGCRPFG